MESPAPILDAALLRAFAAFAEARNFTRAARRVGLSQPALFERVRKLSDQLGVALYERQGRALALTPAGARVAAFARESLARSEAFVHELRGEAVRETVVLAAGEGAYLYLLGPAIARFVREGHADLTLRTLGAPAAMEAVLEGSAHVAVGVVDLVPRGLLAADLLRTPLCAAVAREHPFARKRAVRLADLAGERLILTPEGQSHRDFVGRALAGAGLPVRAALEADGWPLMLKFASLGLGVAVVNRVCELPPGVVARPVPELGSVTYRVLVRRGAALPPAAARLRELLLATGSAAQKEGAAVSGSRRRGSRRA